MKSKLSVLSAITMLVISFVAWAGVAAAGGITMAKYNQVQTGMTHQQVVAILGPPAEELSRVELAGITTVMYKWEGSVWDGNALGSNMNIMFQNGRVVSKAQFGLK